MLGRTVGGLTSALPSIGGTSSDRRRTIGHMLRLLRLALLLVLFFWALGLVIAVGRPETGLLEDAVLLALVVGLLAIAGPVRRIGARAA
jgi:hypothetical protein